MLTDQFQSLEGLEAMSIEEAREVNEREAPIMFGPVEDVNLIDEEDADGVPIRLYESSPCNGRLIYFHGGGWSLGSLDSHDGVARYLCRHAGCAVVSVDYRLAPENPYPAALDDAWAATRWWARNSTSPLAIGGDSSGANLAAVVARRARDAGVELALQLLVYGAFDLRGGSQWSRTYLAESSADDPDASPMLADDLAGVAPALLLSCELDDLRPQAEAYAARLEGAGVPVRHIVYPGLIHNAYRMPGVLPGARQMLEDSAVAISAAFSRE